MCGIAGILDHGGATLAMPSVLRRMAAAMTHRGPDDEGYPLARADRHEATGYRGRDTAPPDVHAAPTYPQTHIDDADAAYALLGLAHRRLSVIDLSAAGHQPMTDPQRRFWLVYNGEIYNAAELRADLQTHSVRFVGLSDTEVLLHGLALWGVDVLDRINGMFALAVWDDRNKSLLLARDRLGIKPLYLHVGRHTFLFASDIKTLLAGGLVDAECDRTALGLTLMFGVAPRPRTAFAGITALRPGHWMRIDAAGRIEQRRYWRVPTGQQRAHMNAQQAVDAVGSTLERVVKRRLVTDVPVGTLLSGGVDSGVTTALAARHHPGIQAFTLAYDDAPHMQEVDEARATAGMHPIHHTVCTADPEHALHELDTIVRLYEEPSPAISANWMIHREVSRHDVKVVLNGLGGDELFGGYTRYRLARWWRLWRALHPVMRIGSLFSCRAARAATIGAAQDVTDLYASLAGVVTADVRDELVAGLGGDRRAIPEALAELYVGDDVKFTDACEALTYFDLVHYVGNHHLYRVDQFPMAFSLEARVPMLDHTLVELAMTVPTRHKVRGRGKHILRQVARQLVHPSGLNMRKKGFGLPTGVWLAGRLRSVAEDKLRHLKTRGVIEPQLVDRLWQAFLDGRLPYPAVWWMVSLEMWFEQFIDGRAS